MNLYKKIEKLTSQVFNTELVIDDIINYTDSYDLINRPVTECLAEFKHVFHRNILYVDFKDTVCELTGYKVQQTMVDNLRCRRFIGGQK